MMFMLLVILAICSMLAGIAHGLGYTHLDPVTAIVPAKAVHYV